MKKIHLPTPSGKARNAFQTGNIDTIVIHAMSEYLIYNGTTMHAVDFLNAIGLSCHYMVTPGNSIIQCANPANQTCWHAKGHNTNSIGIEVLVAGEHDYSEFRNKITDYSWVGQPQLQSTIELCKELILDYPITRVVRHSDIDPDRKIDPGRTFPWEYFMLQLNSMI